MQVNYTTEAFTSLSGLVNFIEANNTTNAGLRWLNRFEEFLQSTLKNPDKIKLCNNLTFSLLSLRCVYFRQLYTSWDRWEFNKIRYKYLLFINNLSICLSCPKLTNCMLPDRLAHYKEIEQSREGKLLVYITGDKPGMETQISNEVHDLFLNHLDKFNLPKKIILYLYTRGGDTMSAWGLINLLKQFCDEYEVIVPSKSRSAGTLICLGAERIIMTKQATLGPIDPSLNSSLNPQNPTFPQNPQARVPISVESIKGYFDYAKEELNIHDEENLSKIFLGLSNQIHPVVIGSVFRSRQQILMLATKLLKKHFGGR